MYKPGGVKNNKKGVPSHFLLAFIIAESCGWCKDAVMTSKFLIGVCRATSAAVTMGVQLVPFVEANAEVRIRLSIMYSLNPF
jgi:hypothetical protein